MNAIESLLAVRTEIENAAGEMVAKKSGDAFDIGYHAGLKAALKMLKAELQYQADEHENAKRAAGV